jgi:hypothetical protein
MVNYASNQALAKELALPASQIPERLTFAHRQQGVLDVPSNGGNPRHRHRAASKVWSLASD